MQWKTIITFTFQFRITYARTIFLHAAFNFPISLHSLPSTRQSLPHCIVIVNHLSATFCICMANFPNYKESKGISGSAGGGGGKQICRKCLYWPASSVVPRGYLCVWIAYWIWHRLNWKFIKTYVEGSKEGITREGERRQTFKWRLCGATFTYLGNALRERKEN